MKTDFSRQPEKPRPDVDENAASEKAAEQEANTCTAVAEPTHTGVQAHQAVVGDFIPSVADMRLPRLNIVHGVGFLKDDFPQKSIVYNQSLVVYERRTDKSTPNDPTDPLELVVLGWLPIRFAEKVPGGARGMLCNTEAEVRAAGGTLDWKEWQLKKEDGMRYFQTLAEAVVLFKRPKQISEDDPNFPFVVENENWALAIFAMKGTAYTNGAKTLFTARRMGFYKDGYPTCVVSCKTRDQQCGPNKVPVPEFAPVRRTTDAFQKFAINLVNGSEEQGAAEE